MNHSTNCRGCAHEAVRSALDALGHPQFAFLMFIDPTAPWEPAAVFCVRWGVS